MLCPVVVGWRINGAWLCEAFDINSENQRPTHWRPIDTPETANRHPSKQAAKDAEDRIRADEREECAKIADAWASMVGVRDLGSPDYWKARSAGEIASDIRARTKGADDG